MNKLMKWCALSALTFAAQALPEAPSPEAALAMAAEQQRDVLLDFTGSDWCSACIHLRSHIIASPDFEEAFGEKFVMLAVDFPRNPAMQANIPEEERARRAKLLADYRINGLPAVVLMDAKGMPYDIICGTRHTPAEYIALVKAALGKRAARDAAFARAATLSGRAKAKALADGLKAMPVPCRKFYKAEIDIVNAAKRKPKTDTNTVSPSAR